MLLTVCVCVYYSFVYPHRNTHVVSYTKHNKNVIIYLPFFQEYDLFMRTKRKMKQKENIECVIILKQYIHTHIYVHPYIKGLRFVSTTFRYFLSLSWLYGLLFCRLFFFLIWKEKGKTHKIITTIATIAFTLKYIKRRIKKRKKMGKNKTEKQAKQ